MAIDNWQLTADSPKCFNKFYVSLYFFESFKCSWYFLKSCFNLDMIFSRSVGRPFCPHRALWSACPTAFLTLRSRGFSGQEDHHHGHQCFSPRSWSWSLSRHIPSRWAACTFGPVSQISMISALRYFQNIFYLIARKSRSSRSLVDAICNTMQ